MRLFSRLLLVVGVVTLAATVLAMGALAAAPPAPYSNGVENAADAVPVDDGTADPLFAVSRVPFRHRRNRLGERQLACRR